MSGSIHGAALALATFALSAASAAAAPGPRQELSEQDAQQLIELVRKDVRAQKADIVAKTMELDAEQAAVFWPIYKEYEAERRVLGDERLAIIEEYAESYERLTDARAKELLTRALDNDAKANALARRYADEFLEVLPAKTVARFYQVESRINNLIGLEASSQIPLVY
jgi:hypothetical protein